MSPTRRDFIRFAGVFLAGVVLKSCGEPTVTCYALVTVPPVPSPPDSPSWAALRECWLALADSRLQVFEEDDFSQDLRARHTQTLDALVSAGELERDVADEIDVAFGQAIAHIKRQLATCYIALPSEYQPRQDLVTQSAVLEEMAAKGAIDTATVEQARAALERDIAWLEAFQAGQVPGALETIEADPADVEAAQILVELLLGEKG